MDEGAEEAWQDRAERVRAGAVDWIKAEPTAAWFEELRWLSSSGGGLREIEATMDSSAPAQVLPPLSRPPWVLAEGEFYFQDLGKPADSGERRWYKITPSSLLQLAESEEVAEKDKARAVLEQTLLMIRVDPLWILENFQVESFWERSEKDQMPADFGYEMTGSLPRPETYSPQLEAAFALLGLDTPEGKSEPGVGLPSVTLVLDLQGRPLSLIVFSQREDHRSWYWRSFERTTQEAQIPSDADDWSASDADSD